MGKVGGKGGEGRGRGGQFSDRCLYTTYRCRRNSEWLPWRLTTTHRSRQGNRKNIINKGTNNPRNKRNLNAPSPPALPPFFLFFFLLPLCEIIIIIKKKTLIAAVLQLRKEKRGKREGNKGREDASSRRFTEL